MAREKPKSAMASLLDEALGDASVLTRELEPRPISNNLSKENENKGFISNFSNEMPNSNRKAVLIKVDPNECVLWRFVDRPANELGDIESLSESMKEYGQQEPILVRKNTQRTSHKYEIIFGNRRWQAARLAGIKLDAIHKDISDQQAALCQKEENENRKELSDYARALSYRSQIDGGVFKNESDLSKSLGISKQGLNDIMAYLRVPEELRSKITNYKDLSKVTVSKLATLSKNKEVLDVLIYLAPKISDKKVTSNNVEHYVHKYLTPSNKDPVRHYIKRDQDGNVVYKIKPQHSGAIAISIDRKIGKDINPSKLNELLDKFLVQAKRTKG